MGLWVADGGTPPSVCQKPPVDCGPAGAAAFGESEVHSAVKIELRELAFGQSPRYIIKFYFYKVLEVFTMKMNRLIVVGVAGSLFAASLSTPTFADTINYSMSATMPASSATQGIDLTDGGKALDWMAFVGINPAPPSNQNYSASTMPVWDDSPSGGTESIVAPAAGSTWDEGNAGPFVQFDNGADPYGDTALSYVTSDYVWNWYTPGTTFTQTLIQPTETLTLPVISYTGSSSNTEGLQVLATLVNSSGTQTASLPATSIAASDMNQIDSTHYDGILTIDVAGAIGDTLSVSIGEPNGNSGMFGVTVLPGSSPVPEPSALVILAAMAGGVTLAWRKAGASKVRA